MSIKSLRKVKDHEDDFLPEDHNDHVDNWKTQLDFLTSLGLDDPELNALISQLKSIVDSMEKIEAGDFYYAEHHNKFVDAWDTQVQINDVLRELIIPPSVPLLGHTRLGQTEPTDLGQGIYQENVKGVGTLVLRLKRKYEYITTHELNLAFKMAELAAGKHVGERIREGEKLTAELWNKYVDLLNEAWSKYGYEVVRVE